MLPRRPAEPVVLEEHPMTTLRTLCLTAILASAWLTRTACADSVAEVRRDLEASRAELIKAINETRAALTEDTKARRDLYERASQENLAYGQAMRQMQEQMKLLQLRLDAAEKRNAELEALVKRQQGELAALVTEESDKRVAADEKIVRELSKALASGVARMQDAAPPAPAGGKYKTLTVQRGDTLSAISKAAGVSIARLKEINGLTSDVIHEGQELKIPE
jgi:LysM repeat protein